jgi:hypothetical protein
MVRLSQSHLRTVLLLIVIIIIQASVALAPSKPHIITFGKWTTVQWSPDSGGSPGNDKPLTLKVRPLLVDAHLKEFTLGTLHDVTDRLFVVRRAFRVNDSLPQEPTAPPHWQWQRGGWLLVDRVTGHTSTINLPEFDAFYSAASWYRDYAAYCGVSEDGKKLFAIAKSAAASQFSKSSWKVRASPTQKQRTLLPIPPASLPPGNEPQSG